MNKRPLALAVFVSFGLIAILYWKTQIGMKSIGSENSGNGVVVDSISNTRTVANSAKHSIDPHNSILQSSHPTRATNSYFIVHSNITITTVVVDGPMEQFIGTDQYELMAKSDFESNVDFETYLKRVRDLIESEKPGSARIYSAVRMVYEMRANVMDMRHDIFDLDFTYNAKIGQIQADSTLSPEEKETRAQSELNNLNAQRISLDVDARNNYERFLKHMTSLIGEPSDAMLERFYAFEPRFSPRPLRPAN